MTGSFEEIASNPLVTVGSFLLAIVSIILAVIFYVRSKREKIPCCVSSSNTIIEGIHKSIEGLEIFFKGSKQDRISITKVAFWNAGKEIIDKNDFVEKDPLRIICPESIDILDIQITNVSSDSNSVDILDPGIKDENVHYPLSFDYIDQGEYFVIQIIHNGTSNDNFDIVGKIKGVKCIEHKTKAHMEFSSSRTLRFMPHFERVEALINRPGFLKYLGFGTYGYVGSLALWHLVQGRSDWYLWVGVLFSLLAAILIYHEFRHVSPIKI